MENPASRDNDQWLHGDDIYMVTYLSSGYYFSLSLSIHEMPNLSTFHFVTLVYVALWVSKNFHFMTSNVCQKISHPRKKSDAIKCGITILHSGRMQVSPVNEGILCRLLL